MGLDTTHDCWHGSYTGFSNFRDKVAAAAKAEFGYVPDYDAHPSRAFYGWWDEDHPHTDILDVFFVHSDCEGYIFPEHAEPLADRLEQLVPHAPDDDSEYPGYDTRARLESFVAGLRRAADGWEVVGFH